MKEKKRIDPILKLIISAVLITVISTILFIYFIANFFLGPFDFRSEEDIVKALEPTIDLIEEYDIVFFSRNTPCKTLHYQDKYYLYNPGRNSNCESWEAKDQNLQPKEFTTEGSDLYNKISLQLKRQHIQQFEVLESVSGRYIEFFRTNNFVRISYIYSDEQTKDSDRYKDIPRQMFFEKINSNWHKKTEDWM